MPSGPPAHQKFAEDTRHEPVGVVDVRVIQDMNANKITFSSRPCLGGANLDTRSGLCTCTQSADDRGRAKRTGTWERGKMLKEDADIH